MTTNKDQRIPFDLELWESGKFEGFTMDGRKLLTVYQTGCQDELEGDLEDGSVQLWIGNGTHISESGLDLFLVPKPQPKGGDEPCPSTATSASKSTEHQVATAMKSDRASNASPESPIPSGSEAEDCDRCKLCGNGIHPDGSGLENFCNRADCPFEPPSDPPLHPLTPSMEAFPIADEVETLPDEAEVVIAVLRLENKKLRLANREMAGKLEEIDKLTKRRRGYNPARHLANFVQNIINPPERKP